MLRMSCWSGGEAMPMNLHGAATVRRRLRAQRKNGPDLVEHLRRIAHQHQVCYEIWPKWSTLGGKRTQKGFDLLLYGVNGHVIHEGNGWHAVPCCTHCAHTYSELREIAEWILDLKQPPSGFEICSFDHTLHIAPPHRHYRSEIAITTAIFDSADHKPGDCGCESKCLKEVRERLFKLGIGEDVLSALV